MCPVSVSVMWEGKKASLPSAIEKFCKQKPAAGKIPAAGFILRVNSDADFYGSGEIVAWVSPLSSRSVTDTWKVVFSE